MALFLLILLCIGGWLPLSLGGGSRGRALHSAASALHTDAAAVRDMFLELEAEVDAEIEMEEAMERFGEEVEPSLVEVASHSHSRSHSGSKLRLPSNHPVIPPSRTPGDPTLRFKPRMPKRLWNLRSALEVQGLQKQKQQQKFIGNALKKAKGAVKKLAAKVPEPIKQAASKLATNAANKLIQGLAGKLMGGRGGGGAAGGAAPGLGGVAPPGVPMPGGAPMPGAGFGGTGAGAGGMGGDGGSMGGEGGLGGGMAGGAEGGMAGGAGGLGAEGGAGGAGPGGDAAGGGSGGGNDEWTKPPVWWKPPPPENVRPWQEDNYGYLMRSHGDLNSHANPNPYPSLASGRFAAAMHPASLHRVLHAPRVPLVAGVPASVYAYQAPPAPPLPELDANMQPQNNYPNPPFYEHDYN